MKTLLPEVLGLIGVVGGVVLEFGVGWGAMVGGVVVGAIGFFNDWSAG